MKTLIEVNTMEDETGQLNKLCSRCNKERIIYNKKNNLCKSCYNHLHLNKNKQKGYYAKWKDKNPNYFKEYNKR